MRISLESFSGVAMARLNSPLCRNQRCLSPFLLIAPQPAVDCSLVAAGARGHFHEDLMIDSRCGEQRFDRFVSHLGRGPILVADERQVYYLEARLRRRWSRPEGSNWNLPHSATRKIAHDRLLGAHDMRDDRLAPAGRHAISHRNAYESHPVPPRREQPRYVHYVRTIFYFAGFQ